jgi:hypothetical protein
MTKTMTPPDVCSGPSRGDNPFATCWTRPGAIPFQFAGDASAERLVARLAAQNWWGAIIGPHGSGKTTLLATLQRALMASGRSVQAVCLRNGQRRLPRGFPRLAANEPSLVIVDGYEQLGRVARWRLRRHCRRVRSGLLVTAHVATDVPLLLELAPQRALVERLVATLAAQVSTRVTTSHVAASHECHGSNVREILFDLYHKHEELRAISRTGAAF